ncbi:hypothetical protein DFJ74DRAFT_288892, partial [Hyaloraphidium curvatum]
LSSSTAINHHPSRWRHGLFFPAGSRPADVDVAVAVLRIRRSDAKRHRTSCRKDHFPLSNGLKSPAIAILSQSQRTPSEASHGVPAARLAARSSSPRSLQQPQQPPQRVGLLQLACRGGLAEELERPHERPHPRVHALSKVGPEHRQRETEQREDGPEIVAVVGGEDSECAGGSFLVVRHLVPFRGLVVVRGLVLVVRGLSRGQFVRKGVVRVFRHGDDVRLEVSGSADKD